MLFFIFIFFISFGFQIHADQIKPDIENRLVILDSEVWRFPTESKINEYKNFLEDCIKKEDFPSLVIYCKSFRESLNWNFYDLSDEEYFNNSLALVEYSLEKNLKNKYTFHAVLNLVRVLNWIEKNYEERWEKVFSILKKYEVKNFKPKKDDDKTYLMADIYNSYGELFWLEDQLVKSENYHDRALSLWEIISEPNDWKILNQKDYLAGIYLELGNFSKVKSLAVDLYESESNLGKEFYQAIGLRYLYLTENLTYGKKEGQYANLFMEKYFSLLDNGFWDDDLAPLARDIIFPYLSEQECGSNRDKKVQLVLKMLNDQEEYENQQIKYLPDASYELNIYKDIEVPIIVFECTFDETASYELASEISKKVKIWLEASDESSFEELYWAEDYLGRYGIYKELKIFEKQEIRDLFYKKAIQLAEGISANDTDLLYKISTITSALLFRIADMSEQVLTECLKIIENLIAKLPDDFNYTSSDFEHIYYNTTTFLAEEGYLREADRFSAILEPKIYSKNSFNPFSLTSNNVLNEIYKSKLGLEIFRIFDDREFELSNKQLNILNSLLKNEFEIAIYNKTLKTDSPLKNFLEAYLELEKVSKKYQSENSIEQKAELFDSIKIVEKLSKKLSEKEISDMNSFILPNVDLEKIKNSLTKDEVLVILYHLPLFNDDYLLKIAIDNNNDDVRVYEYATGDFIYNLEGLKEEASDPLSNFKNSDFGKVVSEQLLSDFDHLLEEKKSVSFITNFPEVFIPSVLTFKETLLPKYFSEINTFFSFSDFFRKTPKEIKPQNYLGFADIDYSTHEKFYTPLPETRGEVFNAMKILGVEKKSYLNNRANEENFPLKTKNAVIHLATHNDFITKGNLKIPAMVMSKTNNSDGYLDIFEVAEGNYQNSEILLSACSTNSSYSADQDSFSGFVKAFTLAGANSILATSWPIDSLSTSEFITSYLKKVNESKNYSTALNRTQREFIDSSNYSHPFFWAPFSVYSSR